MNMKKFLSKLAEVRKEWAQVEARLGNEELAAKMRESVSTKEDKIRTRAKSKNKKNI